MSRLKKNKKQYSHFVLRCIYVYKYYHHSNFKFKCKMLNASVNQKLQSSNFPINYSQNFIHHHTSVSPSSLFSIKKMFHKSYSQLIAMGYKGCGNRKKTTQNNIYSHNYHLTNKMASSKSFTLSSSFKKNIATKSASVNSIKYLEPLVHCNGPYHTLDQLPDEKWQWIRNPSLAESQQGLQNPLANWSSISSLVFRKPHRQFESKSFSIIKPKPLAPKAMLYLRVLQITSQDTSKPGFFRCEVKIGDEICTSSYTISEKCGKNSVQANLDETFLFDISESSEATLSIYSQQKPSIHFFQSQHSFNHHDDDYIGQYTLNVQISAIQKNVQRHVMVDPHGQHYQMVIVQGVYVSHRYQTMINESILIRDYLTVHVRGANAPKLERFWSVVRGVQLELYDYNLKESNRPTYIIPLCTLIQAYHSDMDDQEILPINQNQLTLQFSEETLYGTYRDVFLDNPDFECQMYILTDCLQSSKAWEHILNYVVSIFEEYKQETIQFYDYNGDSGEAEEMFYYPFQYDNKRQHYSLVPTKFLW
ncbi:unnamed protein product [Cunninghamella blakesleeana]